MSSDSLIIEIGCEELPPKRLQQLAKAFSRNVQDEIEKAGLAFSGVVSFASPRRLAVRVEDLQVEQLPKTIERQGPSYKAAYDNNGMPTIACLGFAKSCGVSVDQLTVKDTEKGKRVFCKIEEPGRKVAELIPAFVAEALRKIPMSKPMRWGRYEDHFMRPVHWVLALFGKEIVPVNVFGLEASNKTYGHRFHYPKAILLTHADEYESKLENPGYVVADFKKRSEKIKNLVNEKAKSVGGITQDYDLIEEVAALVEWPVALVGKFDQAFLKLPGEVLKTSMRSHQKCFALGDSKNSSQLLPHFILVSNIQSKDPATVVKGNERVIRARLADAAFFYHKDCEVPLSKHQKELSSVLFQKQLGTMGDKVKRIQKLATFIAKQTEADSEKTKQAASLCKCDLLSDMVGEFPELQGIMGAYYAQKDGESKAVVQAIRDQYRPRFAKDELPETLEGCAISMADKLDTIVGIIGINKLPTGDKDPYGLRRAALGIVRILVEKQLSPSITSLLKHAIQAYNESLPNKKVFEQAENFILERLRYKYLDEGTPAEVYAAVLANPIINLVDFDKRIKAVMEFLTLNESSALSQANKRVSNILKKQAKTDIPKKVNVSLFESDSEKALYASLEKYQKQVKSLYDKADYTRALSELAGLKEPVDNFFDQVMIMIDDKKTRENRLALLVSLQKLFTQVADISLLP